MDNEAAIERKKQTLLALGEAIGQESMLLHAFIATQANLNPTDTKTISLLRDNGPLTPGELAKGMRVSASAATAIIDRLERAGFVRREAHGTDRRKIVVALNTEHMEKINRLYQPLLTEMNKLLSTYKESELDLLIAFHAACIALFQEMRTQQ